MKSLILSLAVCLGTPGGAWAQEQSLTGTVAESIAAGQYTYLRLKTAKGEEWAAVPKGSFKGGQKVTVDYGTVMERFDSPSLKRRFDRIAFGTVAGAASPAAPASAPPGHGHGSPRPKSDASKPIKVPKAEGPDARTVAELFAGRKDLAGKTAVVRGKVVKANSGILDANWLHVRDGSGSEKAGDHDLTVTTSQTASVGDEVLVRGTVVVDKDLGMGYRYPVLLEKATISKP